MPGSSHIPVGATRRRSDTLAVAAALAWLAGCLLLAVPSLADNTPRHASIERTGELRVTNGMTLHLNTDLGNVRIETLPPGAPPTLKYSVRIETDAPAPGGDRLLNYYSLATRETVDTVFLQERFRT